MKVKEGNKQRSPTVVIPNDCFAAAEAAGTGSGFTKTITCGMHTGDEKMLNLTGLEMDTSQEGLKMRKNPLENQTRPRTQRRWKLWVTTYDVESPTVSQYRKFPSSHVSSIPVLSTLMVRGQAVLKGWATENAAREGCLFLALGRAGPFACQFWRQGSHCTPLDRESSFHKCRK